MLLECGFVLRKVFVIRSFDKFAERRLGVRERFVSERVTHLRLLVKTSNRASISH